jgi:hypothetical protein
MKGSDFGRVALIMGAAVAFLPGCGGSPPSGTPGAMPQSLAIARHAEHGRSWMLPEAKRENLLYAVGGCAGTCVLSYPDGNMVGSLGTRGLADCSDGAGNVYISTPDATVVEYAHGGTAPTKTLDVPGTLALGCSVDPTTGNLAVIFQGGSYIDVAVFTGAEGAPTGARTIETRRTTAFVEESGRCIEGSAAPTRVEARDRGRIYRCVG